MKTLIIVTGPTASGKTNLAIDLAEALDTEIVSADSRQIFRGMPIGTAAPTPAELSRVKHHLVGIIDPEEYYSAARFEEDALQILDQIWQKSDYAVMCGGAMMYIDTITNGIDSLPTISDQIRKEVAEIYAQGGIEALKTILAELDPDYLADCDLANHRRLMHAVEICRQAGRPYSQLRTGRKVTRPFKIIKLAINRSRSDLFDRINSRVDRMVAEGLEEEARRLYPLRHLNSLNTVGYKEMFALFDGTLPREIAIPRIAKNTRVYAKKQLLWLSKDKSVILLDPSRPLLPQALEAVKSANL